MAEGPWTFEGEIVRTGGEGAAVTLVQGSNFCLSARNGDIRGGWPHGVFLLDSRFLSRLELHVDGMWIESLGVANDEPSSAVFFGRADATLVVLRRRTLRGGLTEELVVRNHGLDARTVTVELSVAADFATVFEVKESRAARRGWYGEHAEESTIRLGHRLDGRTRETVLAFDGATVTGNRATWSVGLAPGGEWSTTVRATPLVDDAPVAFTNGPADDRWAARLPTVTADDPSLEQAVACAGEDLGSLRIVDPGHPDQPIVAAGAPWFMSPFGRDSLLTAWMALIVDPDLALGVLETLARFQGTVDDPATEEQPGRILHEMRFGVSPAAELAAGHVYYGSVDATPLFVMLLGELERWGLAGDDVEALLPHADRALEWILRDGDRDGDGYVEYLRATPAGLANQGWKDSWDGIRFADGSIAEPPIALCEVQGYTYAAFLARAHFALAAGDRAAGKEWSDRAAELHHRFNRDFWLPDKGWFAVGLDADKRPIDSLASNQGHCLWTGIVEEDKAAAVADALLSPGMFSGWGVRTLSADERAYNPLSYHCGSVWPHDNAIIAAGLVRYGHLAHAHRIMRGMLDVAAVHNGRLPELFSGIGRDELSVPAAYPTSCVPQAWAAATPLLFLRCLLRLEPRLPQDELWLAPMLPDWVGNLHVAGIPLGGGSFDVRVGDGTLETRGLGERIRLRPGPRAHHTELHP